MFEKISVFYRVLTAVFISVAAVFIFGMVAFCQFDSYDEMNYSYGKVLNITPEQIIITEYDYEKDKEVEITYKIDQTLVLQNITSLNDLAKGDEVEIYFEEKEGKKKAIIISRPEGEDNSPGPDDDITEPAEKNPILQKKELVNLLQER